MMNKICLNQYQVQFAFQHSALLHSWPHMYSYAACLPLFEFARAKADHYSHMNPYDPYFAKEVMNVEPWW